MGATKILKERRNVSPEREHTVQISAVGLFLASREISGASYLDLRQGWQRVYAHVTRPRGEKIDLHLEHDNRC